jgi:hypothetical protein
MSESQKNNKWISDILKLNNKIISPKTLNFSLNKFWKEIVSKNLSKDQIMLIQFKIKLSNGVYRSISHVQIITNNDFKSLLDSFYIFWEIKSEEYHSFLVDSIIYYYKILPLHSKIKNSKITEHPNLNTNDKLLYNLLGYNLPTSMELTTWGEYLLTSACTSARVYKPNSKAIYHIKLFDTYQEVELKSDDKTLLTFKDIMLDPGNLTSFKRIIRDQEYLFENGIILLKKFKRKTSFLSKINKSTHRSSKFITMDLETRTINDVMTPYCISIYDGKVYKSFYLSDYIKSSADQKEGEKASGADIEMLKDSIYYLMKRKYDQHKVYLHNF